MRMLFTGVIPCLELFLLSGRKGGTHTVAHKKLGDGDGTSGQEGGVGAELREAEGFPRLARTQFDHMVVTLHQRTR